MKYFVTGGLGVMASRFAASLNHDVCICDDGTDPRHAFNGERIGDRYEMLYAHRLGGEETAIEVDGFDRVLHAAASTGIPYSSEEPLDDWSRNVDGTLEVLEAVRHAEGKKPATVVLSSVKPYSVAMLDPLTTDYGGSCIKSSSAIHEFAQLRPDEPYAASKAAQSLVAQAYARSYDLPIVVFRCSNLCGQGAPHGPRHGWLTYMCIQAALGWPIEIQGSGKQTRDILYSDDLNSAIMAAFGAIEAGDIERGRIYNIGGGPDRLISVLQLVELLKSFGAKFDVKSASGRKNEDMLFCTDSSLAQRELGWERKFGVAESAELIYRWACSERDELAEVYREYAP